MTKNGFSASTLYRLRKNFTGVCGYLVMNCAMLRCAFAVVVGLVAVRFPVAAQQANLRGTIQKDPTFTLSLYEPKIFSASERSVLFHKGPVRAWSDGGRLASENALTEIGMVSLDLFPIAYLPPNASGVATATRGSAAADSPRGNFGTGGKDLPGMLMSLPDQVYYGGEVGVLYGRWTGKGGGDLMESYVLGTVGNDKFQITAGAAYEESSRRTPRFRSFVFPR